MKHNYIVKQHNFAGSNETDQFLTYINKPNDGFITKRILYNSSYEECIQYNQQFSDSQVYYLHAKVKRLNSDFTLNILLVKLTDDENEFSSQFLKSINVKGMPELQVVNQPADGILTLSNEEESKWHDIEVIFKPNTNEYDYIVFQMVRTNNSNLGFPTIIYQELSLVNNYKTNSIDVGGNVGKVIKFGIQAEPGTVMCINGQEIHVGKSGIYEIRNGIIYLDYFSIVQAGVENDEKSYADYLREPTPTSEEFANVKNFQDLLDTLFAKDNNANNMGDYTYSQCLFKHPKTRSIKAFTIDYIYIEE